MALPKLIFTDIDGVWTDGGMYYDNVGRNELKKFNTSDSAGVLFCKLLSIPVVVITGEDTEIVKRRCEKLKITEVHMGVANKLKLAEEICKRHQCELKDVAFIGDDINDILLLRKVGISGAPKNAPDYIRDEVSMELQLKGGEGAFREFVETILRQNEKLEQVIDTYLRSIE